MDKVSNLIALQSIDFNKLLFNTVAKDGNH